MCSGSVGDGMVFITYICSMVWIRVVMHELS